MGIQLNPIQNRRAAIDTSKDDGLAPRPSSLIHKILENLHELKGDDQKKVLDDLQEFNVNMDKLADEFKTLAGKKGKGLEILNKESIQQLIQIVAMNPEEVAELQKQTEKKNYKKLAKSVRETLENPDKVYDIAKVLLSDPNLSERTKSRINAAFSKVGSLLLSFEAILIKIDQSKKGVGNQFHEGNEINIAIEHISPVINFSNGSVDFSDRYVAARSLLVESGRIIDLLGERGIVQKIKELNEELENNGRKQEDARGKLFLILDKPQSRKFLKVKTELLELELHEEKLKDQLESYRKGAAAMAA